MGQPTELLVHMAEVSNLLSVLSVLGGLLVMMVFLFRLIQQDLADGGEGGVTRVAHQAPRTNMARVSVPFSVGLKEGGSIREGYQVALQLSSQVPYKIRYFWGVEVASFHHVLRAPWSWFHQAFLHGNLFGTGCTEYGKISPKLQPHEELSLVAKRENGESLALGPAPRAKYPLVVIAVRDDLEGSIEDRALVTALLTIIHIRDSVFPLPTKVLDTYLKQGAGVSQLLPLFVNSEATENSDTESAEEEETEDTEGPLGTRARCVVCQLERVTRAALPCRHASTCGFCFERLKSQCPMCRAFINSYFLLCPEPSNRQVPEMTQPNLNLPPPGLWDRGLIRWRNLNLWLNQRLGLNQD